MVRVLAFYSDDPSLNLAKVFRVSIFCFKRTENRQMKALLSRVYSSSLVTIQTQSSLALATSMAEKLYLNILYSPHPAVKPYNSGPDVIKKLV